MLRFLTISLMAATLCVAGILYKIKYDTRGLQREKAMLAKAIVAERRQLAILKAEWSFLTRPEQLDRLAKQVGLGQLDPEKIIAFRDLEQLPKKQPLRASKITKISSSVDQTQQPMLGGKQDRLDIVKEQAGER